MVDSLSRRLNASKPEVVSEVVRLSAWMEAHDCKAASVWGALHQNAQVTHLRATSSQRLASLVTAMQSCSDGDATELAAPEDPQVSNLIASCSACKGLHFSEDTAPLLHQVLHLVLRRKPMDNAIAELVEQLSAMKPVVEDVSDQKENELVWAAVEVVKYGVPFLNNADPTKAPMDKYEDLNSALEKYEKRWTKAGHGREPGLLKVWEDIVQVTQSVAQSQADAVAQRTEQAATKLKGQLDELQGVLHNCQWQKDLPSEPKWADVVREIEYTFWKKSW